MHLWQEFLIPCKHAIALMKRRNLEIELDETIKPQMHGPFEKKFDSTSEKEIEVCLCKFCGKKSIHTVRGPPKNARVQSSTDLK